MIASEPRPVSVLVVDDDEDFRDTLAEVLGDEGWTVAAARNGREALQLLRTVRPRLIILDLSMPVMSGSQFRAEQLADPGLASIPTVVMTAAQQLEQKTAGMRVDEVLSKPVELESLIETVARYCDGGGQATWP